MRLWGTVWKKCYSERLSVSKVLGDRHFIVYLDVCLRYWRWEILLCTVVCVWVTGWEKCYCLKWCVCAQSEVNFTCNKVWAWGKFLGKCYCVEWCFLRYMVKEILLCTAMCVWGTWWKKYYCVQWCFSELNFDGNFTVHSEVFVRFTVREFLLCTLLWVCGTGCGKYFVYSDVSLR